MEKELLQCGVQLEKFGGDVQAVKISAVTVHQELLWCTASNVVLLHIRAVVFLCWRRHCWQRLNSVV